VMEFPFFHLGGFAGREDVPAPLSPSARPLGCTASLTGNFPSRQNFIPLPALRDS
jgi:hypothetical protein